MSIVIFGDSFSFPEGEAPTNRVNTYAKGLIENGVNVHLVCFANEYDAPRHGVLDGIHYYYPLGVKARSRSFVVRNLRKLRKIFRTLVLVRKINREDKISMILIYTMKSSVHFYSWILSVLTNARLMKECSEHPLRLYQKGTLRKIRGLIKLHFEATLSDGIFCISHFLINFHMSHGIKKRKLFLIPTTVDPGRFVAKGENPFPFKYIGYFGGLTFKRDAIDVLLRAYALISGKYPEIHLVIGGFCSDSERKKIEQLIIDLGISENTVFLEYLPREEVLRYMTHSHLLVMIRAKDLESQASFPSKLAEYMATGRPVISVNVGEIPDYITDGENAYLVEPGDPVLMSEKIEYVLNNYDQAKQTAIRGMHLTHTEFYYNYQAKRIIQFISELN